MLLLLFFYFRRAEARTKRARNASDARREGLSRLARPALRTRLVLASAGLKNAEKLKSWQQDLPPPSALLSELNEWQFFWKQRTPKLLLPGNLMECVKYADGGTRRCRG